MEMLQNVRKMKPETGDCASSSSSLQFFMLWHSVVHDHPVGESDKTSSAELSGGISAEISRDKFFMPGTLSACSADCSSADQRGWVLSLGCYGDSRGGFWEEAFQTSKGKSAADVLLSRSVDCDPSRGRFIDDNLASSLDLLESSFFLQEHRLLVCSYQIFFIIS